MAVITNLVRAINFHSYARDLLVDIYHQYHYHTGINSSNVSLTCGHLSLSVAPYILASISPMLKNILLEDDSLCSITVHPSFSRVLPCLVTLLYTGQVSNITTHDAELLKLLIKDLDMKATIVEEDNSDIECNVKCTSFGIEMIGSLDENARTTPNPFDDDSFNKNERKSKKTVSFDLTSGSYEEDENSVAFMCPPHNPKGIGFLGPFSVSVADKGKLYDDDDQICFENSFNSSNNDREKIEVITVLDYEVDDIVENVGGSLNEDISSSVVKDVFYNVDSEVDSYKAERCNICDQEYRSKYELLEHLTMTHYKARLAESFSEYGKICPMCEEFREDHEDNLYHIGRDHEVVYDYYKADKFVKSGEFNAFKNNEKNKNQEKQKSIENSKTIGGKSNDSSSSTLKGILKSTRAYQKDVPRSILRDSCPKPPSTKKSILKRPKSHAKLLKNHAEVKGDKINVLNVHFSVQDNYGERIVDLE